MAIAQAVLDIAERRGGGQRVTRVELRVGYLRQVVPTALSFSFELAAQGTRAEGAELVMELVPVAVRCRRCGAQTRVQDFPFQCAACMAFDLDIVSGEELEVTALELEEETDDAIEHQGRGSGRRL